MCTCWGWHRPGEKDYSRLSVHVGLLAKCKQLRFIPRAQFRPPPKVDCAVAEIVPLQPPTDIDLEVSASLAMDVMPLALLPTLTLYLWL